jgi:hypothetical protein
VPFFDNFIKASYIQQPIQLDVKVLLQTGPQIHGKYFTGHEGLPILDFRFQILDLKTKTKGMSLMINLVLSIKIYAGQCQKYLLVEIRNPHSTIPDHCRCNSMMMSREWICQLGH